MRNVVSKYNQISYYSGYCIKNENEYDVSENTCNCYESKISFYLNGMRYNATICRHWVKYMTDTYGGREYSAAPNKKIFELLAKELGVSYYFDVVYARLYDNYWSHFLRTKTNSKIKTPGTIRRYFSRYPYVEEIVYRRGSKIVINKIPIQDYVKTFFLDYSEVAYFSYSPMLPRKKNLSYCQEFNMKTHSIIKKVLCSDQHFQKPGSKKRITLLLYFYQKYFLIK